MHHRQLVALEYWILLSESKSWSIQPTPPATANLPLEPTSISINLPPLPSDTALTNAPISEQEAG